MKHCKPISSAIVFLLAAASPAPLLAVDPSSALMEEMRRTFTLEGKPVPPEVFRDFGDGDLADSGAIWVTVDVKAAIGSNLYFDEIERSGRWINQTKAKDGEQTAYRYIGVTNNGLLVVIAAYSGGGSGDFISLHILDLARARAFDLEGKVYDRVNLTNIRTIPLGDRWDGEVRIENNTIAVITTRRGPADDSGKKEAASYVAERP